MTKKEKESLVLEINNLQMEMKDACGDTVREEELPQLGVDSGDRYEVVATIKLSTGDSFTIHNHCFDSFIKGEYCGDEIHVVDDLLVIGIFDYGEGMQYRSIHSPISNVCSLDVTTVGINWANLWNDYITKHPGFTLPKRSDEDSHSVKYWRAKADEAVDELTAMFNGMNDRLRSYLQSAPLNIDPIGLRTLYSIPPLSIPIPKEHIVLLDNQGDKEK